jgi:hypothetical protein
MKMDYESHERDAQGSVNPNFNRIPDRLNSMAPITLDERLD